MPLLELTRAALLYPNGTPALEGVDLTLQPHEFVSLVGPSGCGKSTLLKMAAGLLQPTGGNLTRSTKDIGYVFQAPTLLPWRTVAANVALPMELEGKPATDVPALLHLVGLTEFSSAYPNQLSGGMQMRVALARSLASRPDVLLLDEPFGALDEITRQRLNEELLALWERDRWTALFVTHNVAEAAFLSERVLVMTARPGSVAAEFKIPFAYPRTPELRSDADFARITGQISARLRQVAA